MSTDEQLDQFFPDEEFEQYRAVSKAAVVAFVMGLLSFSSLASPLLLLLPGLGLLFGLIGLANIRRYPLELTGKVLGILGIVLSLGFLVGGTTYHTVSYLTEVPEGYRRISFDDLQPNDRVPELPVSPLAMQLNGQKVFVRGYVFPGNQRYGLERFILVADLGTCCFGTQPKLTHMIEVAILGPERVDYSYRKLRLTGTLRVDTQIKPVSGVGGVYFQLDADSVR